MAGRLAVLLLKEEFGEIVGCVGNYLVEHGSRALQEIHKGTNLDREQASNLLHMLTKKYQVLHKHEGNNKIIKRSYMHLSLSLASQLLYLGGEGRAIISAHSAIIT